MWHDAGWSQGFAASPLLAWHFAFVWSNLCRFKLIIADQIVSVLSESLQILADLYRSICSCFKQILVDSCWSTSTCFKTNPNPNLCRFKLIIVDQEYLFAGVQVNQAPSPPFPSEVSNHYGKCGGSDEYFFHLIWFQCDGASQQQPIRVVPAHGVSMDTSLHWPEVLRPLANLKGTGSQAHLSAMSLIVC